MRGAAKTFTVYLSFAIASGGCGGGGSSAPSTSPTPPPANAVPRASDLSLRTNEAQSVSDVLPASDADGDTLTFDISAQPEKGQINIQNPSTGEFTYTPAASAFGSDTLTFVASDGTDTSNTGTVTVDINRIPIANEVRGTISSIDVTPWNGSLDGSDPDGDPLSYTFLSMPNKGTLSNLDTNAGTFTYEPDGGQTGTDGFQYEVTEGLGTSSTEWVIITFNEPPSAGGSSLDVLQDQVSNGALSASDPENDALVFHIASQPGKGVVAISDPSTGAYTYTPNSGETGADSFSFTVSDSYSSSPPTTVSVTVHELPIVGFAEPSSYAVEAKTEVVKLLVSQPIPFDLQIYIQGEGTATRIEDYEISTPLPLLVPAMSSEATIDVSIVGDSIDENESLDLSINNVTNGQIDGARAIHTLVFHDWRGTRQLADFALPIVASRARPAMTIDTNGNIYLAGQSFVISDEKRQDALVEKYDKRGILQWSTLVAGLNETAGRESEYATGIAVNADGEVFVAGTEGWSNSLDGFVVKLDANGNKIWHETMVGFGGQDIRALALDAMGNVTVAGYTSGSLNGETNSGVGDTDGLLVKFDTDGNTLWTRIFGSLGSYDVAQDIAIGSTGDLFISGIGDGAMFSLSSPGEGDIFLTRYSSDGNMLWGTVFGSLGTDSIGRIALDAADNIYITGGAQSLISRPGNTWDGDDRYEDVFIAKFNRDGAEQWIRMTGQPRIEHGYGIALDAFGLSYVTGSWDNNAFFERYNASGGSDWIEVPFEVGGTQPTGSPIRARSGDAILEDEEGNFIVFGEADGHGVLLKLDSSGEIID